MKNEMNGNKDKKIFKRVLKVFMVIVAVVGIGAVIFLIRLDSIARVGIEKSMSWALQVPVQIASVHVGILSGEAQIRGLVIGNPEGYKTDRAFSIDRASARFDLASFRSDEPVIYEILIEAPAITLEQGLMESNLSRLAKNTSRFSTGGESKSDESGQAVKIQRLVIDRGQVGISSPVLQGQVVPVLLPSLELTDLGGRKDIPATAEALNRVFVAILEGVARSGQGQIPEETLKSIQTSVGRIETLTGDLKKSGDPLREHFQKAGGEVGGLLKNLTPPKDETRR